MNDENPGLVKTLLGLLGKGGSWLFDKLSTRLRIREIKRVHDSDIDGTLDLFERLFKEQHRIASADLVA